MRSPALPAYTPNVSSRSVQSSGTRPILHWLTTHEESIRRILLLAVIYLIPAMWVLQPVIIDPDIWWHLAAGQWMVEHGQLPDTDPFSAYGEGKPWIAYSWLFEIGIYAWYRYAGEVAIILYTLIGIWALMLVLHRLIGRRCPEFLPGVLLLSVSVVALSKMFTPRPWLLTILFFAFTLEVVLALREGQESRWIWFLPFAYVVWANVHIQFIYGLGLLGLACIAPVIDRAICRLQGQGPTAWSRACWTRLVGVTVLCAIATLATPHHAELYRIIVELAAQTGMWEYTQEMQAPPFRSAGDWAMLALFAVALFRLGWRRSQSSFEWGLLLVAAASAFRGQRDIWFLVLASVAIIVSETRGRVKQHKYSLSRGALAAAILLICAGTLSIYWHRDISTGEILRNTEKVYPIEAAAFVEHGQYGGAVFNHFNWGGYLIWRLPQLKVSMDGRANVHGDERIKRALSTWGGEPQWKDDPELDAAEIVIANSPYPLTSILRLDPRFTEIHRDDTAVVFLRTRSATTQPAAFALRRETEFPVTALALAR
ncbi:MAG TPA: hypothetical protein VFS39_19135 [Nitrospira sp.]|nr:hypothetical protein [Nitrospira sp.]